MALTTFPRPARTVVSRTLSTLAASANGSRVFATPTRLLRGCFLRGAGPMPCARPAALQRALSLSGEFLLHSALFAPATNARLASSTLALGGLLSRPLATGGFALLVGLPGFIVRSVPGARFSICRQFAQRHQLGMRQRAMPSLTEVAEQEWPECHAAQPHHFMSDPGKEPANFTVLPVAESNLQEGAVALRADSLHPANVKAALLEIKSLFKRGKRRRRRPTSDLDGVRPWHLEPRMGQLMCHLAVIGQQDEAFAPLVESADREEPQLAWRQQIEGPRTAGRIAGRAEIASRLVEQEVARRIAADDFPVDADLLLAGVDARAQVAGDVSVYADPSVHNKCFAFAARAESGGGQEPLQADAGCRGRIVGSRAIVR